MTSGGREVDVGRKGSHTNNILDLSSSSSAPTIARTPDVNEIDSTRPSPVRNSLYRILHTSLLMCMAPPYVIHVIGVPRPSPFFAALLLPCVILNANRRTNTGNAWERGYTHTMKTVPGVLIVECALAIYVFCPLHF